MNGDDPHLLQQVVAAENGDRGEPVRNGATRSLPPVAARERRYALDDKTNERLKIAAKELDDARALVRKARRDYEAALAATGGNAKSSDRAQ